MSYTDNGITFSSIIMHNVEVDSDLYIYEPSPIGDGYHEQGYAAEGVQHPALYYSVVETPHGAYLPLPLLFDEEHEAYEESWAHAARAIFLEEMRGE